MINSSEVVGGQHRVSPLEAFTGVIVPAKTGSLYNAGLAVVAFAMVLLPSLYIALIVLAAWGVFYHLTNNTWLVSDASGGGLYRLIIYFASGGGG